MTERGSTTIVGLAIVSILLLVPVGLVAVGRVVAAHVQVTAAADASALAAAPLTFLAGDPKAEASDYARRNGARLVACTCEEDPGFRPRVVTVEVADMVELPVFGEIELRARAAAEFDPMDLLGA